MILSQMCGHAEFGTNLVGGFAYVRHESNGPTHPLVPQFGQIKQLHRAASPDTAQNPEMIPNQQGGKE
jgi:hypothetical protein